MRVSYMRAKRAMSDRQLRVKKIQSVLGKWYGLKYRIAYASHRKTYIPWIGKREITLKLYNKYYMKVRLFSRDLDFFENIVVGKPVNNKYVGEYDIDFDNSINSIIDLGANIGLFCFMQAINFPDKKIIALEPEESNYDILSRNMAQFDNVYCLNAGVWYRDAKVKVYPSRVIVHPSETYSEGAFYVGECSSDEENGVDGYSIETLIKRYDLQNYMVKMDVEGAEYEIFTEGELKWLDNCQLLVMETHEWILPETKMDKVIDSTLTNLNYEKTQLGENKIYKKRK